VPFTVLTEAFEDIADTTKRLEIQNILTATFRAIMRASPSELLATVYLCTNRVSPAHEGLELGLGDSTLIKALAQATGRKESAIKENLEEVGDLGIVAAQSRGRQKQMFKPKPLTVGGVLKTFREIAESEGAKSQDRKIKLIIKLLAAASENEAGYVMRALQGKLRIGLAEQTVLIALAHAKYYEGATEEDGDEEGAKEARERAVEIVKSVYSECPSYDLLIPVLLECADIEDVPKKVHFSPGIPVKPMLAKVSVVVCCCCCCLLSVVVVCLPRRVRRPILGAYSVGASSAHTRRVLTSIVARVRR
jgi:DNA ligase-1